MDTASLLMEKYQTASPFQLAKFLGVEVCRKELPGNIYGIYVPQSLGASVILNSQLAELRQRFILCYDLQKHLKFCETNVIKAPKKATDYDVSPSSFAFDVLIENGDIKRCTWSLVGSFIDAGTPPHIVFGLYGEVSKAKSQYRPLTNI